MSLVVHQFLAMGLCLGAYVGTLMISNNTGTSSPCLWASNQFVNHLYLQGPLFYMSFTIFRRLGKTKHQTYLSIQKHLNLPSSVPTLRIPNRLLPVPSVDIPIFESGNTFWGGIAQGLQLASTLLYHHHHIIKAANAYDHSNKENNKLTEKVQW